MKEKNLLPTLCHLCGMKITRNLQNFKYDAVMSSLKTKYELHRSGGGNGFSPLHLACKQCKDDLVNYNCRTNERISLADGMYLDINFIVGRTNILVLPKCAGASTIARCWAMIVKHWLVSCKQPFEYNYAYILVNPKKIDYANTTVEAIDLSYVDADTLKSTFDAFVTAAVTDDETDFDIEMELQGARDRSNRCRERIKHRMRSMGLNVLNGKKASIFLKTRPKQKKVDLAKLHTLFPDAYNACVSDEKRKYEYLTFKMKNNGR